MSATSPPERTPVLHPLGLAGWLIRFSGRLDDAANRAALAFHAQARRSFGAALAETSVALASVYLNFDPSQIDRAAAEARLTQLVQSQNWYTAAPPENRTLWSVPACFEGAFAPQLAEAAHHAGQTVEDAISQICACELRVLALGFAPGQPYLGTLPDAWNIPRQGTLTSQVPAGALALAVRQITLFKNAAPTGWRHVATTPFRPFQPAADTAFPLRPGDSLRLIPMSASDCEALLAKADPMGGAVSEPLP